MPYTGYDPFGPAPDPSGGGLDPSFYYAISSGGRFPGDVENWLEWMAGQSRGTAGGNPDYDVPDWLQKYGKLGKALGWHERNVREGGEGQSPSGPAGYPYHFFSGPGASYGPPGGPLHGLVDQGRPGDPWDGPDRPPYVPQGTKEPKKKKGGGGGGGKMNLVPGAYQGLSGGGSFVDWQPTQPFSGSSGPTRFVGGGGAAAPSSVTPSARPGVAGPGGRGGGGGKGKGGVKGPGAGGGGKPGPGTTPGAGGGGSPGSFDDLLGWLLGERGVPNRWGSPGPGLRESIGGGVNTNNLDLGTPGWMRDPTTGVHNTGGFPGPTPFGPDPGESFDSYLGRLHDAGFDSGSIGSLLGPSGYRQNEGGEWEWGWGTGPVILGPDGYQFANQGTEPAKQGEGNIPWFWQGGGAGVRESTGGGGPNQGTGSTGKPNAGDYLTGGVFHVPAY